MIRKRRKERDESALTAAGVDMAANLMNVTANLPLGDIALYIAMPGEPPTSIAIESLTQAGHRILVPRVQGEDLVWAVVSADTRWAVNSFGTQEPIGGFIDSPGNPLADCVAVVVPAHAVDSSGMRLGQGKGFYDRALEFTRTSEPRPLLISLTFEDEFLEQVPHEPHDIPVDVSVTDKSIRWRQQS